MSSHYYLSKHQRMMDRDNDEAGRAYREKRNRIAEQVIKEIAQKFPKITLQNFAEADEFRIKRLKELDAQ